MRALLLLFWSEFLLFLFLLWLLWLGLSELCWVIVMKVDILVFFLILGKCFQFFAIENNVCCRLIIYGLYYVEVGSFYAHFWRVLIIHGCWILLKAFPTSINYHITFIFQFVNMMYHIDWFAYIEEFLHPWNKPDLIMMYELLDVLLNFVR